MVKDRKKPIIINQQVIDKAFKIHYSFPFQIERHWKVELSIFFLIKATGTH